MAAFLGNLRNVVIAGFVLGLVVRLIHLQRDGWQIDAETFAMFVLRWVHVICGVMWIGLLWYFNFVSAPTMPTIPTELRPALGKYITPAALFWFRWAAMGTIVFGILLAGINRYIVQAFTLDIVDPAGAFQTTAYLMIGIGMWLGTIMWFNVWFIIWPNQQKALNIANRYPDLAADQKAKAGRTAMLTSRVNTMLSIPMLFCMAAATHILTG